VRTGNMKPTTHTPLLSPSLAQAETLIGGQVSLVFEQGELQVLADQDSVVKNLEVNSEASDMCGVKIMGNAIILKGDTKWA
jgi:hypothetical protein